MIEHLSVWGRKEGPSQGLSGGGILPKSRVPTLTDVVSAIALLHKESSGVVERQEMLVLRQIWNTGPLQFKHPEIAIFDHLMCNF